MLTGVHFLPKEKLNYVTGTWVLTLKQDKDGNFIKCKARWVLRGFQDKQKFDQQTDSPAASRPGFRQGSLFRFLTALCRKIDDAISVAENCYVKL